MLRTLHRLHRQFSDLTERLDRGPKLIRAAEANAKHRDELLTQAKSDAQARRMAVDKKQLLLRTNEDKVKDLRRKLNAATNNREYQALLEQIAADEMAKSVLEDEILDELEQVDGCQKRIAEAEGALSAARQKLEQVRAAVAAQQPSLQADVARIEAELHQTEADLPGEVREMYTRVVRQKGEDALATVDNQFCGGCNQQIPLNMLGQVMLGQPIFCKTCGRLLYMAE
jgi:predicted  nucleic acid-binding Zn-ribbon protein